MKQYLKKYEEYTLRSLALVGVFAVIALISWGGIFTGRIIISLIPPATDAITAYSEKIASYGMRAAQSGAVVFSSLFVPAETNSPKPTEEKTPSKPTPQEKPITPTSPTSPTTPVVPKPGTGTSTVYPIIPGGGISDPNGTPDLRVRILETGIIDKSTNIFTASSSPARTDRIAVRFSIENIGTKKSDSWNFNAILPTSPTTTFNSEPQMALNPGDHIEYTLGFDFGLEGTQEIKITADPTGVITEGNETNNSASLSMVIR